MSGARTKARLWAVAGSLVLAALLVRVAVKQGSHFGKGLNFGPGRVAVLRLDGEILGSEATVRELRLLGEQVDGVKAVVIALDTPGGGVAASQEVREEILRLRMRDGIKVVAAMGGMAASGGYYIASACDEVMADPGTVTGSIGVIMDSFDVHGLLNRVGVKSEVVKSGEFKDAGSPYRAMTARDRLVFQSTISDVYDQFVSDVAATRRGPLAEALARRTDRRAASFTDAEIKSYVESIADGRIYTGRQAWGLGLVDSLGGLEDAIGEAGTLAGLKDPEVITERQPKSFAEIVTGINRAGFSALVRGAFAESAPRLSFLLR